jgi:hypothetical protein
MAKMLKYEVPGGGDFIASHALTNDGDNIQYNYVGGGHFLSSFINDEGDDYTPTVRVDGCISGGVITVAATPAENTVDVSALSCYIAGLDKTGASKLAGDADLVCVRGAGAPTAYIINSIVVDSAGTWTVVTGTGSVAFVLDGTRGAAGEPPLIPEHKIEVGQVRFTSHTAAPVLASEIKQIPNDSREMAKSPGFDIDYARVVAGTLDYPGVTMRSALRAIHTGNITAKVYLTGYEAAFAEWNNANNVQFQGESISSTSRETYSGTSSYTSSEVSDGSFEWDCNSITDDPEWSVLGGKDAKIWLQLYETRTATSYLACQAVVSGVPTVPSSGPTTVSMTLSGGSKFLRIIG